MKIKTSTLMMALLSCGALQATCSEPEIPVHINVLTEDNGQGNEHWRNSTYTDKMMRYINEKMLNSSAANLKLVKTTVIRNSRDYHSSQKDLVKKYKHLDQKGAIVVVISREIKVDTSGRAKSVDYEEAPFFVMRSHLFNPDPKASDYVYKQSSIEAVGRLFVHEFAHQMNLKHSGETKAGKPHTDNFTTVAAGKKHYEDYFRYLLKKGGNSCKTVVTGGTPGRRTPDLR